MLANFITWNVNPEIFRIGNFAIRWYGLLFALSFYFGYIIISKFFKKEKIPDELLDKLTIYMVIGTIVGARLGHCLFYEPDYYLSNPVEILKIWHGGLASHGAAIGILLALYIFSKKTKKNYLWILDRIVIVVALSGFFIRTGNLMNSEIIGNSTNVPWAFVFTRIDNIPRHPAQIYESLSYLLIFIFLYQYYYKKNGTPMRGFLFAMFLILIFSARFLIEFFKEIQVNFERNMNLDMGQLLSIPLIITGIIILLWSIKDNKSGNIRFHKEGTSSKVGD
jgi:prolipoprotein diacylglyceryl transferase